METTRKFRRLPPITGVHFTGFSYAEIESRKHVVSQLRALVKYCLKEAVSPTVQVVIGEWGEGKTEAYDRYVATAVSPPNRTYLVSASTVAQSLVKVADDNPTASLHFLQAVFYAIKHEVPDSPIPPLERFSNTAKWVEEALRSHGGGRILVYVDEFEELILDPPSLKAILSGLKEVMNGQYQPVAEGGQYPGIVSFFLSCTPDAYARMQRDPEIAEVFGSWERRVQKVELVSVRRQEAIQFLYGLMRFAYEDDLPVPLPIADSGVFYTLCTIARGNLGALVTLFTKVFNAAAVDDGDMRVVDGSLLLDILARETVSIYGGNTRCLEEGLLEELQAALHDGEAELFRLLVGEHRAFSAHELVRRLGLPDAAEVSARISRINQKLAARVANPVLQLVPLREGLSVQDLWKALYREVQDGELRVDTFSESVDDVTESLTTLVLREEQLVSRVVFPWDYCMISAFFEGVAPDAARRLWKRVENLVDTRDVWYRISNELVLQLFPTPVPIGLDFIRDRDVRLRMWRDTTIRLSQRFRQDMAQAFVRLIPRVERWDIEADCEHLTPFHEGVSVTLTDTSQGADIRCYCYAQYGDLDERAICRISERMKQLGDAHLAIVVLVGEMGEGAWEEARARDMDNRLLLIPLHTAIAKRLLIAYESAAQYPDVVDQKLLAEAVTRLYGTELEFSRRVKDWLQRGAEVGIVLRDLYKDAARGERDLADSLKFYINMLGEPGTPEAIFEANRRLRGFVPFGLRVGFVPDIDSPERLTEYTKDLARNGFVEWLPDRTVKVTMTPVERRLLQMLEADGPMASSAAPERFVNSAKARNIFDDVYVNILRHKGKISESGGLLRGVTVPQALATASEAESAYKEAIGRYRRRQEWAAFGHVFVTKKRARLFISITDLEGYLDATGAAIRKAAERGDGEVVAQKTALLVGLAEHLQRALLPKIDYAMAEGRRLADDASGEIERLLREMDEVLERYSRWLGVPSSHLQLREAELLSRDRSGLDSILLTPVSEQDIAEDEATNDAFDHARWSDQGLGFNISLARMQKLCASLHEQIRQHESALTSVRDALKELDQVGTRTRSHLLTMSVGDGHEVSSRIYAHLEAYMRGISALHQPESRVATQAASVLALGKMREDLRSHLEPLRERYLELDKAIEALEDLLPVEEAFFEARDRCKHAVGILAGKLDAAPADAQAQALLAQFDRILSAYAQSITESELAAASDVVEGMVIKKLRSRLQGLCGELETVLSRLQSIWAEYVSTCGHFVGSVEQMLKLAARQDSLLDPHDVEAKTTRLLERVVDHEWPEEPLSAYEALKADIRSDIFHLLEKTLNPVQGAVLLAVVDRRDRSEHGWLLLSEIAADVAEEIATSRSEVEQALRALVAKGYLAEGVSIPL